MFSRGLGPLCFFVFTLIFFYVRKIEVFGFRTCSLGDPSRDWVPFVSFCYFILFFVFFVRENCNFWIPDMFSGGTIQGLGPIWFFCFGFDFFCFFCKGKLQFLDSGHVFWGAHPGTGFHLFFFHFWIFLFFVYFFDFPIWACFGFVFLICCFFLFFLLNFFLDFRFSGRVSIHNPRAKSLDDCCHTHSPSK